MSGSLGSVRRAGFTVVETLVAACLLLMAFSGLLVLLPIGRLSLLRMGSLLAADTLASNAMQQAPPAAGLVSYDTPLNGQTFHVDVALTTPLPNLRQVTVTVSWPDPIGQQVSGGGRLQRRTYQELLCDVPH